MQQRRRFDPDSPRDVTQAGSAIAAFCEKRLGDVQESAARIASAMKFHTFDVATCHRVQCRGSVVIIHLTLVRLSKQVVISWELRWRGAEFAERLRLQAFHHAGKRDRFAHVMQPANPAHRAFDTHAEAGVRH
jgi:hypothetical protein